MAPTSQKNGTVALVLGTNPADKVILPVNPRSIDIQRPSRQTVTQTLTGAYQDHLGRGLVRIRLSGITGWRVARYGYTDGYDAYQKLRNLLIKYDDQVAQSGTPEKVVLQMLLDIPKGWEAFRVSKVTANYTRSKSDPLMFGYELEFVALEDLLQGAAPDPSPSFVITDFGPPPKPSVAEVPNTSATVTAPSTTTPEGPPPPPVVVASKTVQQIAVEKVPVHEGIVIACGDVGNTPTIGDLAASFYFNRDSSENPRHLWVVIANANPDLFPAGTTSADTATPCDVGILMPPVYGLSDSTTSQPVVVDTPIVTGYVRSAGGDPVVDPYLGYQNPIAGQIFSAIGTTVHNVLEGLFNGETQVGEGSTFGVAMNDTPDVP